MKIGLFGGTFDPIHCAHLIIAQYIKEELNLNKVVFIPAAYPPHKQVFSEPQLRFKMVNLAIINNAAFECSEIEITKKETSYSVDTIELINKTLNLPKDKLFWIMGSDNFVDLPNWKDPKKIIELCTMVIFPRIQDSFDKTPEEYKNKVIYLKNAPIIDISSTTIRSLVQKGRSIKYLVPSAVEKLIYSENLYR
ncbi:MAG: nicotinate-nucleotide adenylyltransferase [bacterium]